MPTKRKISSAATSRKRTRAASASPPASSRAANDAALGTSTPGGAAHLAEEHGIVLRQYYPPEMTNARARAYASDSLTRPIESLVAALDETSHARRHAVKPGRAVVHWFKTDLRVADNHALFLASQKARADDIALVALYIVSPEDLEAHLISPPRVDLVLRTLAVLRDDLAKLHIPLHVETVPRRRDVPARVTELLDEWRARHLFANMEYEVDELRRDARMVTSLAARSVPVAMDVVHDTCVVPPGQLRTGAGKQYSVYTPWYRSWCRHISSNQHLFTPFPPPSTHPNPSAVRGEFGHLFDCPIPDAPESKRLARDHGQAEMLAELYPAGEPEAARRLDEFCRNRAEHYKASRNFPAVDGTSAISPYLACGAISARTCVAVAYEKDRSRSLDAAAGDHGIQTWISELAWRDFYRHVLVNWPYVCMNKPFKPEYSNIEWSYNREHFEAWCHGRTGYPIVDAAMRQLREVGWMHNRCRMIVSSFLAKDLLLDWRMGERFFMENLIDGDFSSNNGGWGFGASVGVDPQPYFRIFNPLRQSEKFDPDGVYIRKWVPELSAIAGKAVHDPYARDAAEEARMKGYPEPIVDHSRCRARALDAYKKAISQKD